MSDTVTSASPLQGNGGAAGIPAQNWRTILKHAERYQIASDAHAPWAESGKLATDMLEDKQWTEADLRKLADEGRPALVINKIRPLFNLVLGYHLNNQTDIMYTPSNDGGGTAELAMIMSMISKQISEQNRLPYTVTDAYMDGLTTGRGYLDTRMNFDDNIFGNVKWSAVDPFSVYLDPDASDYDLNSGNFVMTTRWVSPDEIEYYYGVDAANLVRPLMNGATFSQLPSSLYAGQEEISPWRSFGGDMEGNGGFWRQTSEMFYNWVDTYRKTILMLDIQHYVRTWAWFFVDLNTGDTSPVPETWGVPRMQRVLQTAQARGEQMILQQRNVRKVRWTHMIGDVIVYDRWSDYKKFTITPFFPYFRRGKTKGFVESLIDSQREINVRRSARQNIIGRSSNGGWSFAKGTLTAEQKANLEQNGGRPGFQLEWDPKGNTLPKPEMIQIGQAPVSVGELEKEAHDNMMEIAGINQAALGQMDGSNISGRNVLAQQKQTVIGLEGFQNNFHRTMKLAGDLQKEIIQDFYTQERVVRITGPGANPQEAVINQRVADRITNDVTSGKFDTSTSETSLSESFLAAQFSELMELKQLGLPVPDDFLVDASSVGRKDELRAALQAARQQEAQAAAAGAPPPGAPANRSAHGTKPGGPPPRGTGPGGSRIGPDGGSAPAGPEPGAPPGAQMTG